MSARVFRARCLPILFAELMAAGCRGRARGWPRPPGWVCVSTHSQVHTPESRRKWERLGPITDLVCFTSRLRLLSFADASPLLCRIRVWSTKCFAARHTSIDQGGVVSVNRSERSTSNRSSFPPHSSSPDPLHHHSIPLLQTGIELSALGKPRYLRWGFFSL